MKLTDEQLAALEYALVKTMEDVPQEVIDKIILNLDPLDPLDTSLKGWVMSENAGNRLVWWATEKGLRSDTDEDYGVWRSWDEVKREKWTVRALTPEDIGYRVRHYTEFTAEEKARVRDCHLLMADIVDLVIDIATRGEA